VLALSLEIPFALENLKFRFCGWKFHAEIFSKT